MTPHAFGTTSAHAGLQVAGRTGVAALVATCRSTAQQQQPKKRKLEFYRGLGDHPPNLPDRLWVLWMAWGDVTTSSSGGGGPAKVAKLP